MFNSKFNPSRFCKVFKGYKNYLVNKARNVDNIISAFMLVIPTKVGYEVSEANPESRNETGFPLPRE
jgi:hypothetical protein